MIVGGPHGTRLDLVVFDLRHRLPVEPRGVLDGVKLGLRPTVEDGVEPEIALEPLRGPILVLAEEDFADAGPAFDLDEADLDEGLRVCGVRPTGDEVEAAVFGLDALDDKPSGLLVLGGNLDRELLDL